MPPGQGCTSSLLLPATCLKPTYSLRRQLMMSYGCSALLTISVSVAVAVFCAVSAGHVVKDESRNMIKGQVLENIRITSRYAAAAMNESLTIHRGKARLLEEVIQDRIVGYPYAEFSGDVGVPFQDITTGKNIYPIRMPREQVLRPDWNLIRNVNATNVEEHYQERWPLVAAQNFRVSTASASYFLQGMCNPSARIRTDGSVPFDYFRFCTTAHNNFTTGGFLHPTNTSDWLSQAAADLVPHLKAMWESDSNAMEIGIFFHNRGAGSYVLFPGQASNILDEYRSNGCYWMSSPNPLKPTETIATMEEIEQCHIENDQVTGREYNPMERDWCSTQALDPNDFFYDGPYKTSTDSPWAFSYGKAVYDRLTRNFIGCTSFEIALDGLGEYLENIDNFTRAALVKTDGTVISGAEWNPFTATRVFHITETPWMSEQEWDKLTNFDYDDSQWQQDFEPTILGKKDGSFLTVYPLLKPGSSSLTPVFWMVFYVTGNVFDEINEIDNAIDDEVSSVIRGSVLVGSIGAVVLLLALWMVTRSLTRPLKWIESVAYKIVNHSHRYDANLYTSQAAGNLLGVQSDATYPPWNKPTCSRRCAPRTEITELVSEFSRMIQGFSGVGASSVAKSLIHEVPNVLRWQADFHYLYHYRHEDAIEPEAGDSENGQDNADSKSVGSKSIRSHTSQGLRSTVGAVRSHSLSHMSHMSTSHNLNHGGGGGDVASVSHASGNQSLACHSKQPSVRSVFTYDESRPDSNQSTPIMRSACVVGTNLGGDSNSSTRSSSIGGGPLPSSRHSSARSLIEEVFNDPHSQSHSITEQQEQPEQDQPRPQSVEFVVEHHEVQHAETPQEVNSALEETTTAQLFGSYSSEPLPPLPASMSASVHRHPSMIREESTGHSNTTGMEDDDFDMDNVLTQSHRNKSSESLPGFSQVTYDSAEQNGEESTEFGLSNNANINNNINNNNNNNNSINGHPNRSDENSNHGEDSLEKRIFEIPMIPPPRINHGPNVRSSTFRHYVHQSSEIGASAPTSDNASFSSHKHHDDGGKVKTTQSSLFRWTLLLIVIPQVLTTICITSLVSYSIINVLPTWVELSEEPSFQASRDAVTISATQRSYLTEEILDAPLRDLHLVTRMAGWLLFGAIPRSDGFTEYWQNAEECKVYGFIRQAEQCPFYSNSSKTQCDCDWNDAFELPCQNYEVEMESRRFQKAFYLGKSRFAEPDTGRRNFTPPLLSREEDGPEKTEWWNNTQTMPGSWKGPDASGYETTYDRVRVASALSTTLFPVYNYMNNMEIDKYFLLAGVSFDVDGLQIGHKGCNFFTNLAHWESTSENRAYLIQPDLCPKGRYGYDPRCRDWYDTGKTRAIEEKKQLFISAPYLYALNDLTETTASSPLIDPSSGEYIGQAHIDFKLQKIISAISSQTDSLFTIMISPTEDAISGGDTLVGPDYSVSSAAPKAIVDLVLPNDDEFSENYRGFEAIVASMKAGERKQASFLRTNETGTEQLLYIAYAPVVVRSLTPIQADDFARGSKMSEELVYSIGVVKLDETLRAPYEEAEQTLNTKIKNVEIYFLVAIILVTAICTAFTGQISLAVTSPTLILLRVVKNINAGRIDDDLPPLEGGSRESNKVYISFAKLFKIVRVSNTAFFSGNLQWAYHFVSDALRLFRKIDDKKAIGVACNNIGNILFAMNEESKKRGTASENGDCSLVNGVCCVTAAPVHFDEAIAISSKDLQDAQFLDVKADYAQQLADRHFNRAIFLLKTQGDDCSTPYAREKGYKDLKKAMALDIDVREYWLHNKILMHKSEVYFDRILRRLQGLAFLRDDVTVRDIWNVRELVSEADQLLFAAWHEEAIPLFRDIDRIGRLQQLESALISLELASNNYEEAARLGMRMVIEDEYLLDSAFVVAADAFFRFMNLDESNAPRWSANSVHQTKRSLREMLKMCKNSTLDTGKCLVFCFALSEDAKLAPLTSQLKERCKSLYEDHCGKDDVVGLVRSRRDEAHPELSSLLAEVIKDKGVAGTVHEELLEEAADVPSRVPAPESLAAAIQLAADASDSHDDETYILFMTDADTSKEDIEIAMQTIHRRDALNPDARSTFNVNVIVINLDFHRSAVEDIHGNNRGSIRASGRGAQFIQACEGTVDKAFQQAGTMISGSLGNARSPQQGITMEKF